MKKLIFMTRVNKKNGYYSNFGSIFFS